MPEANKTAVIQEFRGVCGLRRFVELKSMHSFYLGKPPSNVL